MKCPKCNGKTQVVNSRPAGAVGVYRRRSCYDCGSRFSTCEEAASNARPEEFAREAERIRYRERCLVTKEEQLGKLRQLVLRHATLRGFAVNNLDPEAYMLRLISEQAGNVIAARRQRTA